jgi:copper chaperone CopZ
VATVAVALAALFPLYAGSVLRAGTADDAGVAGSVRGETLRLRIDGMTCEACAASIEKGLREVPGVASASVNYAEKTAVVVATQVPPAALIEAVADAGYKVALIEPEQARAVTGGGAHLFDVTFRYAADLKPPAPLGETDGRLVGSGTGSVTGQRLSGEIRWSNYERSIGEGVCALQIPAEIRTADGATIQLEALGHALVPEKTHPNRWLTALTVRFETDDERYAWLKTVLGLWEGELDMETGAARAHVYAHGQADVSPATNKRAGGHAAG